MATIPMQERPSVSDFEMHVREYLRRAKEGGEPLVIEQDGRPEVVLQDANSYEKMVGRLEELEFLAAVQSGIDQADRGQTIPAEEVWKRLNV